MESIEIYEISPLTSEQTTELLTAWAASVSVASFDYISLYYADFTDDSTCEALASFISDAVLLEGLELEEQNSERPINVVVTPASAAGQNDGTIDI